MYFFIKLDRDVNHSERMDPNDFGGLRSKVKVTMDIYANKLVNTIGVTYFFIKLGRDVNHGERIDPIDFGGKVKVTVDQTEIRYDPNADLTVMYFFMKLGRDVNHGERMNSIDIGGLSSKGEGHAGYY